MKRASLLLASSLVLGCTVDDPDTISVATFNAGLTELFVDHTPERAPLVADALASVDADVICVQEVWGNDNVEAIRAAAAGQFPSIVTLMPRQESLPQACEAPAVEPLAECVAAACSDPPEASCILEHCAAEFEAQEGECGVCLASSLGLTIAEIESACTTEAPRYQYDGSYGLMLLSRIELTAYTHLELSGSLNRRAVIHAEVYPNMHVFCTHLTAVEPIPYPVDEGSWEEEQQGQIDAMKVHMEGLAPAPSMAVLLGDLNVGPEGDGYDGEQPDAFADLLGGGWASAFRSGCTFCSDNPLVEDSSPSVLIDHALVRGATATAERILDAPVDIDGSASALSDHYGVRATVTR